MKRKVHTNATTRPENVNVNVKGLTINTPTADIPCHHYATDDGQIHTSAVTRAMDAEQPPFVDTERKVHTNATPRPVSTHGLHNGVLYVDESQIRSRHDIDKLRGLQPTSILVTKAQQPLSKELQDYLFDVLAPMDVPPTNYGMRDQAAIALMRDQAAIALQHMEATLEAAEAAHQAFLANRSVGLPIINAPDRQAFIDAAAIAMHARGTPLVSVWRKATELWESRAAWLKQQNGG